MTDALPALKQRKSILYVEKFNIRFTGTLGRIAQLSRVRCVSGRRRAIYIRPWPWRYEFHGIHFKFPFFLRSTNPPSVLLIFFYTVECNLIRYCSGSINFSFTETRRSVSKWLISFSTVYFLSNFIAADGGCFFVVLHTMPNASSTCSRQHRRRQLFGQFE